MSIRFDDKVAIVTGAGAGLGRSHAIALAARGAKVVVNDLGASRDGSGASSDAALAVVETIEQAGGVAMANGANVASYEDVQAMVADAEAKWGRVDILINNAGILRDKTFAKMSLDDFKLVVDVHLMGSVNCTKAVWDGMRERKYGRIVMTTSSSGMYGNFGQSNYGAAKMAVLGLMNTLALEGAKSNVHVNALSPVAATRMTEDLMPKEYLDLLIPEVVTAGVLTLCHENSPSKHILCAGAGGYASSRIFETDGVFLPEADRHPEGVLAHNDVIFDTKNQRALENGGQQTEKFLMKAIAHLESQK